MSRRRVTLDQWIGAAIAAALLVIAAASVVVSLSAVAEVNFDQTNAGSVD